MSETYSANNRSAVSNGKRFYLSKGGEQSLVGRRVRDIFLAIVEDRGGADRLSEGETVLARRIATLAAECEAMEDARAGGGTLDIEAYSGATNTIGRQLARLGLKRASKDVTPVMRSLEDWPS